MKLFDYLLYLHIAGGGLSLIIGMIITILIKGDKRHKQLGNLFFWSMLLSSIVSLPMSIIHPNIFLMLVGIWTIYMLLTGKRFLSIKTLDDVKKMDWTVSIAMLIIALVFFILGIHQLVKSNSFGTVLIVFGSLGFLLVKTDIDTFRGKSKFDNFGLMIHIQRMMGAFIASTTAFIVVNNKILPDILAWLLPTIFLTPLIIKWGRKWGRPT